MALTFQKCVTENRDSGKFCKVCSSALGAAEPVSVAEKDDLKKYTPVVELKTASLKVLQ